MRTRAGHSWQDSRSTEARLNRLRGRHELTFGVVGDCLVKAIPLGSSDGFVGLLERLAFIEFASLSRPE